MKKLIYLAVITMLCALSSCSQNGKSDTSMSDSARGNTGTEDLTKMKADNELVNRAIETGNFKGIDTLWTDDVVDHTGINGKEIKGKDSILAEFAEMRKTMKDIKITSLSYAFDPEKSYLYSLSNFTGTTTATMDGMPANTKMNMNSVDVLKIKNGKVSDHWAFNDPNEMMKMMAPNTKK